MMLYAIHHDRTRPWIVGPLTSIDGKCALILVDGTRKRVAKKDLRIGRHKPAYEANKRTIVERMAEKFRRETLPAGTL
jgi:hypothetical protein